MERIVADTSVVAVDRMDLAAVKTVVVAIDCCWAETVVAVAPVAS